MEERYPDCSFFVTLSSEIVDAETGKAIQSISESESEAGKDPQSTRILNDHFQTVGKKISEHLKLL